jgi:formate hydrogenlyase subunit 3/multisubunit Na+/H+ antiporter MnhD subunit
MSNRERLDFNLGILIILAIFLIIYLVASLLFKYLIKSNKIKPSRVSRMFYMDDEKFIKNWEKRRKRGKFLYVLSNLIINSIVFLAVSIIYSATTASNFNKLTIPLPLFCGQLIGNIIGLPFRWNLNEIKYDEISNNP